MSIEHQYLIICKPKKAEQKALWSQPPEVKDRIVPLFELTLPEPNVGDNDRVRSMRARLSEMMGIIEKACRSELLLFNERLIFIDSAQLLSLGDDFIKLDPLNYTLSELYKHGLNVVPVTRLEIQDIYKEAVARALRTINKRLCLRIQKEDFEIFSDMKANISLILKKYNVGPENCDIVLDLENHPEYMENEHFEDIFEVVLNFPYLNDWRTFTLAGGSFPQSLKSVEVGSYSIFPRKEWILWKMLIEKFGAEIARQIAFGDYGIQNYSFGNSYVSGPRNIYVNLRYTFGDNIIAFKKGDWKDKGGIKFNEICRELVGMKEFSGETFSQGDKYIYDCSLNRRILKKPEFWREVGFSHHFTLAVNQVDAIQKMLNN